MHSAHSIPNPYIDLSDDEKMKQMAENCVNGSNLKKYNMNASNIIENKINYYKVLDGSIQLESGKVLMYEDKEDNGEIVMILTFDTFNMFNGNYYKMSESERFSKLESMVNDGTASSMELVMYAHSKIKQYID